MIARFLVSINDTSFESNSMVDIRDHLAGVLSTLAVANAETLSSALLLSIWHGKCDTLTLMINDDTVKVGRVK